MMIKTILSLLLLAYILPACSGGHAPGSLNRVYAEPVHLNLLDTAQQYKSLDVMVRPVQFIRLQVPESEVISRIGQVLTYRSQLICVDKKFSSVLVFDTAGRFIKKIGKLGKGPGKYLSIEDVFIDAGSGELTVFSNSSRELVIFNLENNETRSLPLEFNGWRCVPLEHKYFAFYLNFLGIINNHHNFFLTDSKGDIIKEDLAYPALVQSGFEMSGTIVPSGKGYLLASPFSDTIYYGTEDELQPAYVLGLGQHRVPVESMINTSAFISSGQNYAYAGPALTDLPQALFFDYTDSLREKFAIYDKKNRKLCTTDNVQVNASSLLFSAPVGNTQDGKVITALYPDMLPYFEKAYPLFNEEIKKLPGLHEQLQQAKTLKQPVLAIYAINN